MKNIKNTDATVNKYNDYKDELYRIETFYNKKIHELTSIANSVLRKSLGKNTHGYLRKEIIKDRRLEWLYHIDTIRSAYWFIIEDVTCKEIRVLMRKRTFSKRKWEEVLIKIPQEILKMTDRDFAKLIRQQAKEYKLKEEQRILQDYDEILEERLNQMKTLESEINHIRNLKKKEDSEK